MGYSFFGQSPRTRWPSPIPAEYSPGILVFASVAGHELEAAPWDGLDCVMLSLPVFTRRVLTALRFAFTFRFAVVVCNF